MIRILVVDDHEFVRTTVSAVLREAKFDVVATCADGLAALAVAERTELDVVLMDLSMPGLDGVEATRRMVARRPGVRVVIFTSNINGHQVREALAAGAVSCVFKNAQITELVRAVRDAANAEAPGPAVAALVEPAVTVQPTVTAEPTETAEPPESTESAESAPAGWRTWLRRRT
jgi:DNA-binding NarL/FixJ family response regulator